MAFGSEEIKSGKAIGWRELAPKVETSGILGTVKNGLAPLVNLRSGQLILDDGDYGDFKKNKKGKNADANDASKQIAAKIAQLEQDAAGERDQNAQIDREVKKANEDLSRLLSTIEAPMSRIETVQKKYGELLAEMKRMEREYIKSKKRADQLQKEKDNQRTELTRVTAMKDKLEKMSRDLTKDNRRLKDDVARMEKTDSQVRGELHERLEFLSEYADSLSEPKPQHPEPHPVDVERDELFRQKFKSMVEQFDMRELQFRALLRAKDLEIQYHTAKLDEQRKAQELEASKSNQLTRQVSTFSQTETELRNQLNIYVEKFKQVEDTLNNSNDLFLTFRREMEDMSKKTKRLEKENSNLMRKQESTNRSILDMAEQNRKDEAEIKNLRKRNEQLQALCRGMQAQGRGQVNGTEIEEEGEETDSEYEYEDDEEGSADEYDEDTEEEADLHPRTYGPVPPPPPPPQTPNGSSLDSHLNKLKGQVNGMRT